MFTHLTNTELCNQVDNDLQSDPLVLELSKRIAAAEETILQLEDAEDCFYEDDIRPFVEEIAGVDTHNDFIDKIEEVYDLDHDEMVDALDDIIKELRDKDLDDQDKINQFLGT
jgi:hypothetical protein